MILVQYIKPDYRSFARIVSKYPIGVEIGSKNGYGWEVVTIQQLYEKEFRTYETVINLIEERRQKIIEHNSRIDKFVHFLDVIINA